MDQMTLFDAPPFPDRLRALIKQNKIVNVPVAEFVKHAHFGDQGDWTVDKLRTYKIDDSCPHFVESLRREGVVNPIEVGPCLTVWNGHHRLFVAEHIGLETVPVQRDPYGMFFEQPRDDLPWSGEDYYQYERLPLTPLHFG